MKNLFKILLLSVLVAVSCSEGVMDGVNKDRNNATNMSSKNLIPDLLLKSGFESTATDIAWYATVYVEHNAGTWNQSYAADRRQGQGVSSLLNNSWNNLYNVMTIAKTIIDKTDPQEGDEPDDFFSRGLAELFMAYNLAITTDGWGEAPYSEAFQGASNTKPVYEKQSDLYKEIQDLLDDAISDLQAVTVSHDKQDYIYGGDVDLWVKAAYALKARYALRLTNIDESTAAQNALAAVQNSFQDVDEAMYLGGFVVDLPGANPWGEFEYRRHHLSVSSTIFDLMDDRNDTTRMNRFFDSVDPDDIAPIGEADQDQGKYAKSNFTSAGSGLDAMDQDIIMFSYHELKFIEAEAKFRTGDATWQQSLEEAIQANFELVGLDPADATTYFNDEVTPRLTAGNELEEIITQKYIAFFDREAIEAYNDYRRTRFPEMKNPRNQQQPGFIERFPFAQSEESNNGANVPKDKDITSKVWWAGGSE